MRLLRNGQLTGGFDADCTATREILTRVVLTTTLRGLERDGLVERTVHPTNPPQVEYALSELGRTLLEPITALAVWAQGHRAEVYEARERFDGAREPADEPDV